MMAAVGNSSKNLTKLATLFKEFINQSTGFEAALKGGRLVSVVPGKVEYEMEIRKEHTNSAGMMHGGFTALIVDNLTGAAIVSSLGKPLKDDNFLFSGVSVALNLSYLRPGKLGETILAKANVVKMGKLLAFTSCEISSKDDGKLIATGQHTKFVGV